MQEFGSLLPAENSAAAIELYVEIESKKVLLK